MTQENNIILPIAIGQRSVIAPGGSVLIGTGNREEKYARLLEDKFFPMLLAAAQIQGPHLAPIQREIVKQMGVLSHISEIKVSEYVASHTLVLLARLVNAIKTSSLYSVRLNYALPRSVVLNVQKVIVEFVLKHEDFFMDLYNTMYPSSATTPAEAVVQEEPTPAENA